MTDDPMFRSLRDAADPVLAPGAGERIASGAWGRAAALSAGGFRVRLARRAAWAAAAAVLLAAAAFAVRGTDAAFAVEGDPVMVQRDGAWVATRSVHFDSFVRVPEGRRVLRWTDGGALRPQPGSVFRLVRAADSAREVRVEFESGGGDVEGTAFVVATRDVVVERDPSAATLSLSIVLDAAQGRPRVEVDAGRAWVRASASRESLFLGAAERAALVPVYAQGASTLRLTKLSAWSSCAEAQIADGRFRVMDANFDPVGGIVLVGGDAKRGFTAFEVPAGDVRTALAGVNRVATRATLDVRVTAPAAAAPRARYVWEKGDARVEVVVGTDGSVDVKDAVQFQRFASVAALRRARPEIAALFGDALDR